MVGVQGIFCAQTAVLYELSVVFVRAECGFARTGGIRRAAVFQKGKPQTFRKAAKRSVLQPFGKKAAVHSGGGARRNIYEQKADIENFRKRGISNAKQLSK